MEEKKKKSGKWRHRALLIALAAVGVMLILLGNNTSLLSHLGKSESTASVQESEDELLRYARTIEQKIVSLCESIEGAGQVRAIVSFEGDFAYRYATDRDTSAKEGAQSESAEYVTVGSGASESALLLTRTPPAISGIGVVCTGGDDAAVRREITALLGAAFGIGTNKIYVVTMAPIPLPLV